MIGSFPQEKRFLNMADPLLSSYSDSANLFSVLQTHETVDRFKQWVIDHYTGLYIINDPYSDADCSLSYTQNYGESLLLNCDLLEYRKFDRADVGPDGVASWIRQAIDEGFYVAVSLNKYYLPCAAEYRKRHFNHQTMFYGYDHRSGLLYAADGYKGGKYALEPITYEDVYNAYNAFDEGINPVFHDVYLLRKYTEENGEWNTSTFRSSLADYVHGTQSAEAIGGLALYDRAVESLSDGTCLNWGFFHVLHERNMLLRVKAEYLQALGLLDLTSASFRKFGQLEEDSLRVRNFHFKYQIMTERVENETLKGKVRQELLNLKELDAECCELLMNLMG
ncbi:hypothetical protein NSQ91_28475 [Paenibacillus sp. FSL R7-0048]|uniref:hypothetical protein n=1 Tax=Paenibacillus TaxID=44249 RepID=UPI00096C5F5D|nr:hypothetical protein [Paenibacillus odorifer]OMD67394.1 hypothetical protein BSK48_20045 [Paenibacillus odorifer]OMD78634.1 hypothetical protein BSK53_23465 [Paenibacillus odorifer]